MTVVRITNFKPGTTIKSAEANAEFNNVVKGINDNEKVINNHKGAPVLDHPDGSVTTAKLANNAVTSNKLATSSVTPEKISDGAVSAAKIADGAVVTAKIANSAITSTKIATGAITTDKVANGAITADKLDPSLSASDLSLNQHRLAGTLDHPDGSVTTAKIANRAVTASKIASAAVTTDKVADRAITADKLDPALSLGDVVKIADVLLTGASVTISNLPQTFEHLRAIAVTRSTYTGISGEASHILRLNEDRSNVYYQVGATTADTFFSLSPTPGAQAEPNWFSMTDIFIGSYSSTDKAKTVLVSQLIKMKIGSSGEARLKGGIYGSTDAITSLTLNTSSEYAPGSRLLLYGYK